MNFRRFFYLTACVLGLFTLTALVTGYKSVRVYNDATAIRDQVKYLLESGETVETVPAGTALSASYLEIIFGDNPDLLARLKEVIDRATKEKPHVLMGDISAIVVTYGMNDNNEVVDVAAQIMGEFPLGKRPVGLQEGGYFDTLVEDQLWDMGQSAIRFLGRSVTILTAGEEMDQRQQDLLTALFTGDITVIAEAIVQRPVHYTILIPMPRQIVPPRLAPHVKTMLLKGFISPTKASAEMVFLSPDDRSAERVEKIARDIQYASTILLRAQFGGAPIDTDWSPNFIPSWWAYEMANTLEDIRLARQGPTVSMSVEYERVMVNVTLKTLERFGQDYSGRQRIRQDKTVPPELQNERRTAKFFKVRYDDFHQWGPDWPIGGSGKVVIQDTNQVEDAADAVQLPQLDQTVPAAP